jgi:hypothetical protein
MNSASSATSCLKHVLIGLGARKLLSLVAAVVLAGATGCGESSDEVSVQGRVTLRGQPLPNGSVTFYPTTGRPVNAPISGDGAYSAQLLPGEYAVTVSYTEPLPEGFTEGDPTPKPKFVLPPEYTTRARSRLTATVSDDSEAPINFDLK